MKTPANFEIETPKKIEIKDPANFEIKTKFKPPTNFEMIFQMCFSKFKNNSYAE